MNSLRTWLSLLLIGLVLLNGLAVSFVKLGFELNKKYAATALCENRAQPELHCEGSCVLKRAIQTAKQETSTSFTLKLKQAELIFSHVAPVVPQLRLLSVTEINRQAPASAIPDAYPLKKWQPPRV
ncbi:MAG: hypothetical protein LPJ89_01465 [Hymenobacteraceae bacterium]|nr:hypothetical protein [Hymenobacteraceae bacterium]MDX5395726.1 hypothetical protein [Hymenobacteraceae bacterium]MDX5442431.1 hypothetical protein [Hymenobacteraceae bacterium]MDX5511778.1 hypothetical protein [Hymenobacteraceae bacterium]